MKVLLYSQFGQYAADIEPKVKSLGFEIVGKNPDVVITFGGDGTLLGAERDFPGVPKLILKNSRTCRLCSNLPNEEMLELLPQDKLTTKEFLKVTARYKNRSFTSLNEFVFRNKLATTALRLSLNVNGQPVLNNQGETDLIGDGIVVATAFGSTGYFHSITKQSFDNGIGIAFNNLHNYDQKLLTTSNSAEIVVKITRGPADFTNDNNPEILTLNTDDEITITKSHQSAKILTPV